MPTVTTGAVEFGATTTSSPFVSLVLSISMWNRFTHFPRSLLPLVSHPQNSFPVQPTSRQNLVGARALPDGLALHKHAQIRSAIRGARLNAHALLCNLGERADRSTPRVAPVFRDSPVPVASEAAMRGRPRFVSSPARRVTG